MWSRGGGGGVGQEKVDRRPPKHRLQTPGSVGPCSSFKFKFKVGAAAAIAARLQKLQLQDRRAAALAAAAGTRTVFHHFRSWLGNMVVSDRPPHSLKSSLGLCGRDSFCLFESHRVTANYKNSSTVAS